ncbi:MAG: SURF1 family protein [Candidatus Nanopelagicales bacterium]
MSSYGFLRQPRWLALGFLVLIVVPSFILLSRWQLHRLDERRHQNSVVETNSTATPVPVGTVMVPGAAADSIGDDEDWKQVTATGRYDVAHQVLVRKRPLDGANGYWVVTPLVTDSGTVLAVNRGWLEAKEGATAEVTDVPAPPAGEVTVVGRVRPSEEAPKPQPSDLPAGQVTDLDVSLVANGSPVYPGYVDLVSSEPAQEAGLSPIPLPDLTEGPHLSYAMQWVLFAVVAVVGFVLLVRRERDYADEVTRTDVA